VLPVFLCIISVPVSFTYIFYFFYPLFQQVSLSFYLLNFVCLHCSCILSVSFYSEQWYAVIVMNTLNWFTGTPYFNAFYLL
jgi:hypothetical protein